MNTTADARIINNPYSQIFILLACLYLLLPDHFASVDVLCRNVGWCLDSSFMLGLNRAVENNLIFGREYVYTYGSLGFLGTRVTVGINRIYLLLSDVFILANLLFILRYFLKKFPGIPALLFCFFIVLATSSRLLYREGLVFILLLISIFWLNYAVKHLRLAGLIVPTVITILLFFIKINVSFVGLMFFYVYLIYFLFAERERKLGKILFGLAVPCAIFLLSFPLQTDLPGYVRAGLSVIDGYNDAMNTGIGEYRAATALALAVIPVFLIFFAGRNFKKNFLVVFSYCAFSYVLFKQSFVRSDGHILIFFSLFPAFVGILTLALEKPSRLLKTAVIAVTIASFAVGFFDYNYLNPLAKYNYLTEVFTADDHENFKSMSSDFALPENISRTIGQKGVDILPWEINLLYFNRLNYNPRPVPQSFGAYTPYLVDLNREKFESASAPEFVVISNQSIDNRYAFFDDQPLKISLIKDYSYKDSFHLNDLDFLLFQRNLGNALVEFAPPTEESIRLGKDYFLQDTNKIYFIKMKIDYSLLGKAIRFAYKPFVMTMIFTLEDGSTHSHRAVIPILESGVIVNPYVENQSREDLFNVLTGNRAAEKKIKSFRFEVDSSTAMLKYVAVKTYEENIKLSVSEISIRKNSPE